MFNGTLVTPGQIEDDIRAAEQLLTLIPSPGIAREAVEGRIQKLYLELEHTQLAWEASRVGPHIHVFEDGAGIRHTEYR